MRTRPHNCELIVITPYNQFKNNTNLVVWRLHVLRDQQAAIKVGVKHAGHQAAALLIIVLGQQAVHQPHG
jgi:hypothetical protein